MHNDNENTLNNEEKQRGIEESALTQTDEIQQKTKDMEEEPTSESVMEVDKAEMGSEKEYIQDKSTQNQNMKEQYTQETTAQEASVQAQNSQEQMGQEQKLYEEYKEDFESLSIPGIPNMPDMPQVHSFSADMDGENEPFSEKTDSNWRERQLEDDFKNKEFDTFDVSGEEETNQVSRISNMEDFVEDYEPYTNYEFENTSDKMNEELSDGSENGKFDERLSEEDINPSYENETSKEDINASYEDETSEEDINASYENETSEEDINPSYENETSKEDINPSYENETSEEDINASYDNNMYEEFQYGQDYQDTDYQDSLVNLQEIKMEEDSDKNDSTMEESYSNEFLSNDFKSDVNDGESKFSADDINWDDGLDFNTQILFQNFNSQIEDLLTNDSNDYHYDNQSGWYVSQNGNWPQMSQRSEEEEKELVDSISKRIIESSEITKKFMVNNDPNEMDYINMSMNDMSGRSYQTSGNRMTGNQNTRYNQSSNTGQTRNDGYYRQQGQRTSPNTNSRVAQGSGSNSSYSSNKSMTYSDTRKNMGSSKSDEKKLGIVGALIFLIIIILLMIVAFLFKGTTTGNSPYGSNEITNSGNNTSSNNDASSDNKDTSSDNGDTDFTVGQTEDADDISMFFGGDVLLSDSMINTYNRNGTDITNILSQDLVDLLKNGDIAMVNEEFPFSTRGEKMQDKQYTFRADPMYTSVFKEMGVDVVSLANNHILDFGTDALTDTIDTLDEAGIEYVGAGKNLADAKEIKYFERKGKKVAVVGASRVIPVASWNATAQKPGVFTAYDTSGLINEIQTAEGQADFTVVFLHWGLEKKDAPETYQRENAKAYIDAGADVVIGCHSHCLQGIEYYNNKPIVYSLGNFMFGGDIDKTMLLNVIFTKDSSIDVKIIPCKAVNYYTSMLTSQGDIASFFRSYEELCFDVKVESNGQIQP